MLTSQIAQFTVSVQLASSSWCWKGLIPVLYCEIFGDVVVILLSHNLLFCNALTLSRLAYPSFLCESYSDPSHCRTGYYYI
jgi:hypothetical protein